MIKLSQTADSVAVKSPYDSDFVAAARSIGGKWDREQGLWVFPSNLIDEVRQIMMANYHTTGESPEVKLKVTVSAEISGYTAPAYIGPVPVAQAWGRDGGAKPLNGACFIKGKPRSGGSIKNWYTIIPEDSEFTIRVPGDLAEYLINEHQDTQSIEIGYYSEDNTADKQMPSPETVDALIAERQRLMDRIAEIDNILARGADLGADVQEEPAATASYAPGM